MLDLGSLLMESDAEAAAGLPADAAALYQCLRLTSRDISAYLVDGAFSFAALERAGAAAAGPVRPAGRRASRAGRAQPRLLRVEDRLVASSLSWASWQATACVWDMAFSVQLPLRRCFRLPRLSLLLMAERECRGSRRP